MTEAPTAAQIAEAKELLREKLLRHPDEGVRAMAEIAEPADDHPAVVKIASAIAVRAILMEQDRA